MPESEKCSQCEQVLNSQEFLIEEIIKHYDTEPHEQVLFRLVICMDCAQSYQSQVSRDSSEKINSFFKEKVRSNHYKENEQEQYCLINGTAIELEKEYQRVQSYYGDALIRSFCIGEKAIEEINELLSEETKGFMDDFMENNFGLPPEYKGLFKPILV